ncbi:hypothetical protein BaRGS_00035903, partial [Batillaria attramentaria]
REGRGAVIEGQMKVLTACDTAAGRNEGLTKLEEFSGYNPVIFYSRCARLVVNCGQFSRRFYSVDPVLLKLTSLQPVCCCVNFVLYDWQH